MKFRVILEVEVENSTTEAEGRKAAYNLAASLNQIRKGRTPSGPVASLCGITVEVEGVVSSGRNTDAME